jgi:hypothetical protein
MLCYICNKQTKTSLHSKGLNFGYCEEHNNEVLKGVGKFILNDDIGYINDKRAEYLGIDKKLIDDIEE